LNLNFETGQPGVQIPIATRAFFSKTYRLALGNHPGSNSIVPGSVPGIKWLGHDVDHSPPFNAEVKNECSYTDSPRMPSWHGQEQLELYFLQFSIQVIHYICNSFSYLISTLFSTAAASHEI